MIELSSRYRFSIKDILFLAVLVASLIVGCSSTADKAVSSTTGYQEVGKASYYASKFQGRKTASGEPYDKSKLTAAHRKLPFGTTVRVTNLQNGRSVTVRINDRGPFIKGRIIDLSSSAFSRIANLKKGIVEVRLEIVK